jgi:hypothetical protein
LIKVQRRHPGLRRIIGALEFGQEGDRIKTILRGTENLSTDMYLAESMVLKEGA